VSAIPDVVVVGAAARDIDEQDPRGWRLGGGVTYGSLALARLGIRTGAVLGLDPLARDARELELLRDSGVDIHAVPLETGPVFHNIERPSGRLQISYSPSDPVPADAAPSAWREARAWLYAPVAAEIVDAWAEVPPDGACVALGWQGMLRRLPSGLPVERLLPAPSAVLRRVTILGMSRHDVPGSFAFRDLANWLAPGAEVLLTAGAAGGLVIAARHGGVGRILGYRALPASELDPTGAGDVALAAFVAARVARGPDRPTDGRDVQFVAAAAALLVERPGLDACPRLSEVRARLAQAT
jgi:sugar/nucleoside kinase (ribokinase family)